MKVIVSGGRDFNDYKSVVEAIEMAEAIAGIKITTLVSGMCRGVDLLGVKWADENNIPVDPHPYISKLGKAGGPVRNQKMLECADALIAIWDGQSSGTGDMIRKWKAQKSEDLLFIYYTKV